MLSRFEEIPKRPDPCPFPFLFSYSGKDGKTGVATDSPEEALRLVLIQAGIARFNDLQKNKSANVKKELSEVFMTLALASKVCGDQLQPEHNPPAVRMNFMACVALMLEINVYHYVVYVKDSDDLSRLLGIQRNIGQFIKEIKQAEVPKTWLSWIERVQTWHRQCLARLKALEYYLWAVSSPVDVESCRIADSLLEAQSLLQESKSVDASFWAAVMKELKEVGWVHKRSPDFKPNAWNSIVSGGIYPSISPIDMWSDQVMTLSGQMLTTRLFGEVAQRYMNETSKGDASSSSVTAAKGSSSVSVGSSGAASVGTGDDEHSTIAASAGAFKSVTCGEPSDESVLGCM